MHVHYSMCVRLEDNSVGLVVSFYLCMDSGDGIRVTRLLCQAFLTAKLCHTHARTHTHAHSVLIDKFYL